VSVQRSKGTQPRPPDARCCQPGQLALSALRPPNGSRRSRERHGLCAPVGQHGEGVSKGFSRSRDHRRRTGRSPSRKLMVSAVTATLEMFLPRGSPSPLEQTTQVIGSFTRMLVGNEARQDPRHVVLLSPTRQRASSSEGEDPCARPQIWQEMRRPKPPYPYPSCSFPPRKQQTRSVTVAASPPFNGTAASPGLAVFPLEQPIYAQVIDESQNTLCAASPVDKTCAPSSNVSAVADAPLWPWGSCGPAAWAKGIQSVVFDRRWQACYHGGPKRPCRCRREKRASCSDRIQHEAKSTNRSIQRDSRSPAVQQRRGQQERRGGGGGRGGRGGLLGGPSR